MADKHGEALCGLMDGELGGSEARFLIRRLGQDRELTARWGRYHLARAILRERARVNLNGFAKRVVASLDADSAPVSSPDWSAWLKPIGGAALAASVALLVFNVWRQPALESTPQVGTQTLLAASSVDSGRAPLATPASASQISGVWNPRLQGYLIRHNEATAPGRSQGLVPYWSLVSGPAPKARFEEEPEVPQIPAED